MNTPKKTIAPTTSTIANAASVSRGTGLTQTIYAKTLRNPTIPPPQPTWDAETLRRLAPMITLMVSVSSDGVSPAERATRLEGKAASLIRLAAAHSGSVTIVEGFSRDQISWDEGREVLTVEVGVRVDGYEIRTFAIELTDDPDEILAEDCLAFDLNHEMTIEKTPCAPLFEWISDLLVSAGH